MTTPKDLMIERKLNELADLQERVDKISIDMEILISSCIPGSIQKEIKDIKDEYEPMLKAATEQAARIEKDIKAFTTSTAKTVKGEYLMAVYTPPRDIWNGDALKGYAVAHPEILEMKTEGKPSVAIRKISKKDR